MRARFSPEIAPRHFRDQYRPSCTLAIPGTEIHAFHPPARPAAACGRHSSGGQRPDRHADRAARRGGRLCAGDHRPDGYGLFLRLPDRLHLHFAHDARFAHGICFAGLFTVVESWINAGVANRDRARVLAVYRTVDIAAVTSSQFLIPLFGVEDFAIFAIMAIMVALSLVPVSLGDRSNPSAPETIRLDLARAWRISPLAASGSIAVGLSNSAFRMVGPVYAQGIGMTTTDVAIFMSAGIAGSALVQYPLGALSDRWDRRRVVLGATIGAMVVSLAIALFSGDGRGANFALIFVFGAFAMPIYSLAVAHANDHAEPHEFVLVSAALLLFYSIGAIAGPLAGAWVIEVGGPHALFFYTGAVYAVFSAFTLYRMRARAGVPQSRRSRFTALLRTSPLISRLARRDRP
jgi:MFS family permease